MLKIDLFNPETEKTETFTEVFVPARAIRKVLEFSIKQEKESPSELETMDELVALIASLFRDERVNFDSIYDGIPSNKLNDELSRILADVMGGEAKKKMTGKASPSKKD